MQQNYIWPQLSNRGHVPVVFKNGNLYIVKYGDKDEKRYWGPNNEPIDDEETVTSLYVKDLPEFKNGTYTPKESIQEIKDMNAAYYRMVEQRRQ